jgi:hypothetical protein
MTDPSRARNVAWMSLAGLVFASLAVAPRSWAADAGAAPSPATDPNAGVAVAWIVALRDHDAAALEKVSGYPFTVRDAGESGHCKSRSASTASKLKDAVSCLLHDDNLHEDLAGWPKFKAKPVQKKDLPPWTRKWLKEIPVDAAPYMVRIQGSGSLQSFVLLIADGRVRAVWRSTGFDAG